MDLNPYEPPREPEAAGETPSDPLLGPSVACVVVSTLSIIGSLIQFGSAIVFMMMIADLDDARLVGHLTRSVLAAGIGFVFGVIGFVVAIDLRKRRRLWLAVAWSIASIFSCVFSPVGVILLLRLSQPQVSNSFIGK